MYVKAKKAIMARDDMTDDSRALPPFTSEATVVQISTVALLFLNYIATRYMSANSRVVCSENE